MYLYRPYRQLSIQYNFGLNNEHVNEIYIVKKLGTIINNLISNPLNNESSIKSCEIIKAIKSLKSGKSSSVDLISNEMLKNAIPSILDPLTKFFNFIFNKANFPKIWSEYFSSPTQKRKQGGSKQLQRYFSHL